jgi:hypothetical protein
VRGGRRGAGGLVFIRCQEGVELARDRLPFPRGIGLEDVRKRAPSRVAGERGLLRFGRVAVFRFDLFEDADRLEVGEGFFPKGTCADTIGFRYSEIPRRGRFRPWADFLFGQ